MRWATVLVMLTMLRCSMDSGLQWTAGQASMAKACPNEAVTALLVRGKQH